MDKRVQSTPTRWQSVIYNPLGYIHPQRLSLPAGFEAPAQRAAINAMLLRRYRLEATPIVSEQAAAAGLLLKHWFRLPQIALLLGCQRLRLSLARRGALLRLPLWAQTFASLPLLPQLGLESALDAAHAQGDQSDQGDQGDHGVLLRHGMQQLGIALGPLPTALVQRIPLMFAPAFDTAAAPNYAAEETRTPAHSLTLTMAIQHVKRYPASA
jgi:type III secretion system OrgA/MxiK family protein